ncbi:unnamed protein product [Dibothriocephalus latus]|uniref:Uncharacterized protein n=1 Tax=Dibothriocephalus latus TaxID=60516 RepID=A0A3P7M883_DIBLA|nr:unnamed protein product [Dibothriocephalus latus]
MQNTVTKLNVVETSDSLGGSFSTMAADDFSPSPRVPKIEVNTDVGRSTIRLPNLFQLGVDYSLWVCRAQSSFRGLTPRTASSYLNPVLDDVWCLACVEVNSARIA